MDGSIDSEHLAADVIDETKIADDGIDSEHYNDGSIDLAHMSAESIDSDQYVDASIDGEHLAADIAITTTGAVDFGGASQLEIPQSASTLENVVNAVGEMGVETDTEQF